MSFIGFQCPDGLNEREVAAFRMGALAVLLAAHGRGEAYVYLDAITRKAYEDEIRRHEKLLGATVAVEL
jgi:hypothetical protein